ncbi:sigma-70 family RNA polymerase sigma factor [Chitinophaga sp. CF418]|uniref:sigma-70 family RNA polymerase sigma factor n=1 Tax=Chitinophaga sp. CF418 TaxID=1855287 RepID=UPI00091B6670|nr:sigma-70 family RNA polymerase sigma factor [Chitinophaga sp. CF418]SHM74766.1 RNA polymerase sigma-70 factor, ECF subfamily [Chitinophaga sp. CF418]
MRLPDIEDNFALFSAAKAEDSAAFKVLYQHYWKKLYISACKRVDPDEAKDIVQDVMLSLWRRKKEITVNTEDDLSRYLYTALRYRIISYYAFSSSTVQIPEWFDQPVYSSFESSFDVRKMKDLIDGEVDRMPERMQQIYHLSREQDLSVTDIATQLNLSEQTVRNQLSLAMKRLRAILRNHHQSDLVICSLLMIDLFNGF